MYRLISTIALLIGFSYFSEAQKPDLNDKIKPDPEITIGTLENGIKYYIKQNNRPENRAEVQMVIKAGSLYEDPSQYGLAHFLEHMAFNGTKNFPKNKLVEYLESTGMSFGGDINASTSWERVYYTLQIPTDNEQMLDDGFQVLRDWLSNITLDEEQIESERKIIIEEWRLRTQEAASRSQFELFNSIYKDSRYEEWTIGDTNVILNAPRKEFVRYYEDYYRPDITAIIAVGDFDKDKILKQIKDKFGNIPKVKTPTELKEFDIPEHKEPRVSIYENNELPNYQILMTHRHYDREQGTYKAYRESLIENLASTMLSLRFQELTTKGAAEFQFAAALKQDFPGNISPFLGVAGLKADKLKEGYRDMLKEIFRMDQHGFLGSEYERAKARILTQYESGVKNKDNIQSANFAAEFSRNFLQNEPIPGVEGDYEITKMLIEDISLEEVNEVASSFISNNSVVFHHTGPSDLLDKETILSVYEEVKSSEIEPWVDESASAKLMEGEPQEGEIVDMSMDSFSFQKNDNETKNYNVITYELSNGVKVRMMKTDLNDNQVVMRAISPGGNLLSDEELYYSAVQSDNYIGLSGIGENDLTTVNKILSDKNVSVSPYTGDYQEGLRGQASPDDLKEMFQMIHLYFTSPRQDDDAISAAIDRLKESVKNSGNDPNSVFSDSINAALYNNHPRQFNWTMDKIEKIDPTKSINWYKDRFADASDFTFYFVGKFEDGVMNEMITKYLASLPTKDREENWVDRKIRPVEGPLKKVFKVGTEAKSSVRLRIDGKYPEWGPESNMKLRAVARALQVRITEILREEKQIVYSAGAFASYDKIPEQMYNVQVVYQCDPERVDEGVEVVKEQMKYLQKNKLDETYMKRVKEVLLSQYKKALENNYFWAGYLQNVDWLGSDMKRIKIMLDTIENMTAEDIQSAAKKYFKIDQMKQFIRMPETM